MVLSGHAFPNGGFHQPRQRRQHVDRRVDLQIRREKRVNTWPTDADEDEGMQVNASTSRKLTFSHLHFSPSEDQASRGAFICVAVHIFDVRFDHTLHFDVRVRPLR